MTNVPSLPSRLNKTTRRKAIDGSPLEYTVVEEEVFPASSNTGKAFCLHKLQYSSGKVEFRIGYYMIAHKPRVRGKWAWGQYAPIMTAEEMKMIFNRIKARGWVK
jgi:hypothetical protein